MLTLPLSQMDGKKFLHQQYPMYSTIVFEVAVLIVMATDCQMNEEIQQQSKFS